jgi:hypothetical protein
MTNVKKKTETGAEYFTCGINLDAYFGLVNLLGG